MLRPLPTKGRYGSSKVNGMIKFATAGLTCQGVMVHRQGCKGSFVNDGGIQKYFQLI